MLFIEGNEKRDREDCREKRGDFKRAQLQDSLEYYNKKLTLSSVKIRDKSSYLT